MFEIRYVIRPGDTFWKLAQIFHTSVESLMNLNKDVEPLNIQVGEVIRIRSGDNIGFPVYCPPVDRTLNLRNVNNAQIPEMPVTPGTPVTPVTPGMPATPGMPVTPDMTPLPSVPSMPRVPQSPSLPDQEIMQAECIDVRLIDIMNHFRMLWIQHIIWSKLTIMATLEGLESAQSFSERLLENPVDFANAFRVFYGDQVADEFQMLFTSHIEIASDLTKAIKANKQEDISKINSKWHENAEEIANFLARINPNWHVEDWSAMLNEHLELLKTSMENTINQEYMANIRNFDEMDIQALEMADIMGEGIYMQFPM